MLKLDAEQAFEFYRSFLEWYAKWFSESGQFGRLRYLEIGCNRGDTCWRLSPYCDEITAVDTEKYADWYDPINQEKFPNLFFYHMTSDEFFSLPHLSKKQFDLIFIDGDHSQEQVVRDISNSLLHLAPDGLVVLHDTFPPSLSHTGPNACGTAYKAIEEIRESYQGQIELFTFPVTFGVTLLAKWLVMPWERPMAMPMIQTVSNSTVKDIVNS